MLQTPSNRRFGPRPSLGSQTINTASSPNLALAHHTAMARKASLNALTGMTPRTPQVGGDGRDIEVGDMVDVPGDMHGTVKFIGPVKGKKGTFAGVELSKEFAGRGKNDGDVDGVNYFTTSIAGSGIFLPLHRATKRASGTLSPDTFPPTPTTPAGYATIHHFNRDQDDTYTPPTPALKFSQSVGPGARAPSPVFKPKSRPSLPRPESPLRKPPQLQPTPSKGGSIGPSQFSRSQIGAPRFSSSSPAPQKVSMAKTRTPAAATTRPFSRTGSRLGERIDEDAETTPIGIARTTDEARLLGRPRPASNEAAEIQSLKTKLEERDKQLKEQAATLTEMENSLQELQQLIPAAAEARRDSSAPPDADAAQLRAIVREKNEKISILTAEFDAHRADFRSTIDTLEMASTETERVYEKRVEELLQEVRELQDHRGDDFEGVALQLKQLEELVAELEEGLEDARRGEAEARGEVEFLRGEVERGRSELRREREKAAEALKTAGAAVDSSSLPLTPGGSAREVEARDDEIRGLKAIIHSLSSGPDFSQSPASKSPRKVNGVSADPEEASRLRKEVERLEREKEELQGMVERKRFREEELEREISLLRPLSSNGLINNADINNKHISTHSEHTLRQDKRSSARDSKGTVVSWRSSQKLSHSPQLSRHDTPTRAPEPTIRESREASVSSNDTNSLWCEICETAGHDILNCPSISSSTSQTAAPSSATAAAASTPTNPPLPPPSSADRLAMSPMSPSSSSSTTHHRNAATNPMTPMSPPPPPPPAPGRDSILTPTSPRPTIATAIHSPDAKRPSYGPPETAPPTAPLPNPFDDGLVKGKGRDEPDPEKWCALCERDGHDATCCPFEDAF